MSRSSTSEEKGGQPEAGGGLVHKPEESKQRPIATTTQQTTEALPESKTKKRVPPHPIHTVEADSPAVRVEQERVQALAEQAQQEEDRLRALREQAEREARERAEAAATAERLARERAEAKLKAETLAREQAEASAKAEREAIERADREAAEGARQETERIRNYSGPRFGTLEWEGDVHGMELITVENGRASSGNLSGNLPGVPVLVQPTDLKKVGIASSPGPRNNYKTVVFRVSGHGHLKATIRWTVP